MGLHCKIWFVNNFEMCCFFRFCLLTLSWQTNLQVRYMILCICTHWGGKSYYWCKFLITFGLFMFPDHSVEACGICRLLLYCKFLWNASWRSLQIRDIVLGVGLPHFIFAILLASNAGDFWSSIIILLFDFYGKRPYVRSIIRRTQTDTWSYMFYALHSQVCKKMVWWQWHRPFG